MNTTKIFARLEEDRQFLVYSMSFSAKSELAMVLPIPVKAGAKEDAVRFIDLSAYPNFFDDLEHGFPAMRAKSAGPSGDDIPSNLVVHSVGSFDASFVPRVADFARLDERFRLPAKVWDKLPVYRAYGFAVFKLKPGKAHVHPMAFAFPTSKPQSLFFPTVHIHDGTVHERARFDHVLYAQPPGQFSDKHWRESHTLARSFVDLKKASGIVAEGEHVYKRALAGQLKNQDTWIG